MTVLETMALLNISVVCWDGEADMLTYKYLKLNIKNNLNEIIAIWVANATQLFKCTFILATSHGFVGLDDSVPCIQFVTIPMITWLNILMSLLINQIKIRYSQVSIFYIYNMHKGKAPKIFPLANFLRRESLKFFTLYNPAINHWPHLQM